MKPRFFATPEKFRVWLAKNHGTAPELLVGFYKKGYGKPRKPETRKPRLARIIAMAAAGTKR